jgi:hypothetical protein
VSFQKNIENVGCNVGGGERGSRLARQRMVEEERIEKTVGWLTAVQQKSD